MESVVEFDETLAEFCLRFHVCLRILHIHLLSLMGKVQLKLMPKESKSECTVGDDASVTHAFISGVGIFKYENMFLFQINKSVICSGNSHRN